MQLYKQRNGCLCVMHHIAVRSRQMAEHDPQLEVAGTASSGAEADLMCQRLAEAGIKATSQRAIGGPEWGTSGSQYVYVEKQQLERAREILAAPSDISED